MTDSFQDRRKYVRVYRNFIISYKLKDDSQIHEMSQVNNISKGGINFTSTVVLNAGAEVVIELKTPFLSDNIHLIGTVLESKEKIRGLIYAVRLEFKNPSEPALEILTKIEQYASQQEK
jgi:hypothetical protein